MSNDNDHDQLDGPDQPRARRAAASQPSTEQLRIVGAEEAGALVDRAGPAERGAEPSAFAAVPDRPRPSRRAVFESIPDAADLDDLPLRGERWPTSGSSGVAGGESHSQADPDLGGFLPEERASGSGGARSRPTGRSGPVRATDSGEYRGDQGDADDRDFEAERVRPTGAGGGRRGAAQPEDPELELPHWTVPPTGQVPRVLSEDRAGEDSWSAFGASPRWRGEGGGAWADEAEDLSDLADSEDEKGPQHRDRDRPAIDQFFAFDDEGQEPSQAGRGSSRSLRREERDRLRGLGEQPLGGEVGPTRIGPVGSGPPAGRNVSAAVLLGLGLAALAIALFRVGPAATMLMVLAVVGVGAAEFFDGSRRGGYRPATLLGLAGSLGVPAAVYWRGEIAYPIVFGLVMMAGLLWFLFGLDHDQVSADLGLTVLGVMYVGGLGSFAALILRAPGVDSTRVLLGGVVAVVAHDVLAYVVGRNAGRTPLMVHVSPNKTVEGMLAGSLGAVIASVVFNQMLGANPWAGLGLSLQLGLVVAVLAPLGDLCESLIKRDFGVKDMGTVLPGHGGMLDRFDTLLFCLPGVYYLALWRDLIPG